MRLKPIVQVALDFTDIEEAAEVGRQASEGGVDWIEAGTPLIKSEGISSVRRLREEFPDKKIFADMKTMDTGELEVELAGKAGADIVSVMAVSADETIEEAVRAASERDLEVTANLLAVREPSIRAREVEELGVDYIEIHVGIDQQRRGKDPLKQLRAVMGNIDIPIAIAGGLDAETAPKAVEAGASIIIVGSAITSASDPGVSARSIVEAVRDGR